MKIFKKKQKNMYLRTYLEKINNFFEKLKIDFLIFKKTYKKHYLICIIYTNIH